MTGRRPPGLTLRQLFALTTAALALVASALFTVALRASTKAIVARSEMLRELAARRIEARVESALGEAAGALEAIARDVRHDAVDARSEDLVEARLFSAILGTPHLSDVTLTGPAPGEGAADGAGGQPPRPGAWQVSVFRVAADPQSAVWTRRVHRGNGGFVASVRARPPGGLLLRDPLRPEGPVDDPTAHLTFKTTASKAFYGTAIWTDLHYSELDAALPRAAQRVIVSVQKTIEDSRGRFVGVLRVGMLGQTIDEAPRVMDGDEAVDDPRHVFLCDDSGRLVSRIDPRDPMELSNDDIRVPPRSAPPEVRAALASPALKELTARDPERKLTLEVGGVRYLATFRALAGTQDWIVGIVVPEQYYTRDLRALRDRLLVALVVVAAVVLLGGSLALGQVRRALRRVVDATSRMRDFDFRPGAFDSPIRDVAEVMEGVERAKTAMRGLGKYVPINLVRQLFDENREPLPGGELRALTLMFTDVRGFTALAERISPDALARALGAYFEAMATAIQGTGGTVDKFIGDAVMAFWNAPTDCPDHPLAACRAVLACAASTERLFASPAWQGLPPLFTRFGLHTGRAMVGNFGAPDRLNYTALGDDVNLASRLESLGKQYGVAILVSEAIERAARGAFVFRLVDRVAVKGKSRGVRVYELRGEAGAPLPLEAEARQYEQALALYFHRDFEGARALLAPQLGDGPSRTLHARCERLSREPPPEGWDGVFVAESK